MGEVLYRDDDLTIIQESDGLYLESFRKRKSLEDFNHLMRQFPNIKITSFLTVKKALSNAPFGPELFGITRERVMVDVSADNLEARVILNINEEDLIDERRKDLIQEVVEALNRENVNYGLLLDVLQGDFAVNEPIVIARGVPPVNGKDSVITLFHMEDPKPTVVDNGNVNFYHLNLIHQIQSGEWLGERRDPVPGTAGKSVRGKELPPLEGIILPLYYDRDSVELVREEGKDVLYALKTGAVHFIGESIAVYDVMEIKGDVDFNTGNIDFDGYVNIKGTVEENFSIRAKKDIEIAGEYGIGGVDTIESTEGNIYIRGGIAGKSKAKIICKKNLYVKYLSDVDVICEGNVYVGFYVRNANIRAKQIIVDSPRGQIVGGTVDTDIRVECADIGNWMETRTKIIVRGFSRSAYQARMDEIASVLIEKKEQLVKLKLLMKKPEGGDKSKIEDSMSQKMKQALRTVQEEIRSLEGERVAILNYVRTPGDGAVIVRKKCYPKVKLVIQDAAIEIAEQAMGSTFIAKDGTIVTV